MALEFDSQGFLKGDPIDLGRMPGYLRDIKNDVAAIKKAVEATAHVQRNISWSDSSGRTVATPNRDVKEGFVSKPSKVTVEPVQNAANLNTAALVSRISAAFAGSASADPMTQAMREVVEPMQQRLSLFDRGEEKKQTGLLRKIMAGLSGFRKEASVFDKAQAKVLKSIDEKTGLQSSTPSYSTSIIDKIPIIGAATRALGKTALGGGLLGLLTKGGRGAAGLFKRVPVLGALLAGAGAAFDIYGSENNDSMSRREKDAAAGQTIGGWSGSLAGVVGGAMAGSAAGPVGTIVGGIVGGFLGDQAGQIIGEKFGTWVNDLRNADLPGKLVSSFERWTGGFDFQKGFELWMERTKSNFGQIGDVAGEQLNDLNTYIDKNVGVNLKDMGGKWLERTKQNMSDAWGVVSGLPSWVMDNSTVGKAGKRAFGSFNASIPGMSDAQAAAFILEVQRTESGGDPRAENNDGFIGKYQAGAAYLSDAGLINRAKLDAARKSGKFNQKAFLADNSNWNIQGGKEAFFSDETLQDRAFLAMQKKHYVKGVRSGAISMAASPEQVAAYLKAAHLGGGGGANDYFLNGIDRRDSNGTPISKYAMQGATSVGAVSVSAPLPSVPKIQQPPPIAESPQIIQPLGSSKAQQLTVNIQNQDVGQNLSDRRCAHVVTGGISGS